MHTQPEIITSENLQVRSYVKIYVNGKRYRFYNGKAIDIHCNPNFSKTIKDRNRALQTLSYNLRKKLEQGWSPEMKKATVKPALIQTASDRIKDILLEFDKRDISGLYNRDIQKVGTEFLDFLKRKKILSSPMSGIAPEIIGEFLQQYSHSSTYYMNKRRTISGIFSRMVKSKELLQNPVLSTERLKEKATLHQAYTRDQLTTVLEILKEQHSNLHLCALLMYGCFLRPHQEIRQLFRRDLNSDLSSISLGGDENKSGRIRTVYIPDYVRDTIVQSGKHLLNNNANIFTGTGDIYNASYFNTAWSRIKESLLKKNIIGEKHTLYSFRHTSAINLYMRTKDLYKIQQAMGHSSMTVSLKYLRSLGLINNLSSEDAPEL